MDKLCSLRKRKIVLFDGGMGTLLVERGLAAGEKPEVWNLTHPEVIRELHRAYIAAGADIIKTNTFGAYRSKFGEDLPVLVEAAMNNAVQAVREEGRDTLVALDLGPTGKLLSPLGELPFEEAVSLFAETVRLGAPFADLILIETMSDLYELKAAVLAAKENSSLPVVATVTFDEAGKLMTGADVETVVATLEGLGVDALGMNCGFGPAKMIPLVRRMTAVSSLPVVINPNAGLPAVRAGKTVYDLTPSDFIKEMETLLSLGVSMAGGCCGTTPDYIRALAALLENKTPPVIADKGLTVVSSYTHTVRFDGDPVLIGERLNPTGKAKLKAALREGNLSYLVQEGIGQEEKGAAVLDVNVGLPELSEPEVLPEVVQVLQEVISLPLQIDTSDPAAMERACRIYNGKPLINSVNGKKESMEAIFPIAKKYGGVVIALTLDEEGIPATVEGRLAIAERIYAEAARYGIAKKDIILDPLALTVSSDSEAAKVTLGTVKAIRERGGKSSLGVSNISFGLPERDRVNATFFAMALSAGLDAAIMNPFSDAMMNAYRAYRVLAGLDISASAYIASISEKKEEAAADTLKGAVIRGLKEKAIHLTEKALCERAPMDVINEEVIPALDEVGAGFEKGTLFLPQLLASAEAAKAAFEAVKKAMPKKAENGRKIILATVKGDIHDIGKNIVKVMLENYGFSVLDLGRDVPPERVVETAIRENVRLVGLSALMTTTVVSMEQTIKALRASGHVCKIMVGGAVMNEEYAAMIGADRYTKDATESLRYAEEVFAGEQDFFH